MNKLSYRFIDGSKIDINLLNNNFVSKWISYLIKNAEHLQYVTYNKIYLDGSNKPIDKINIDQDLDLIEKSLIDIGVSCNLDFIDAITKTAEQKKNSPNISQEYCNCIHRIFTRLINNQNVTGILPIFQNNELCNNIHNLNDAVHRLETMSSFKLSERRKEFFNPIIHLSVPKFSYVDKQWIKDSFDPLIESYDYTVWLNEDILGKDMIRSWLDYDNNQCDDITGNLFFTPSLLIDPFKTMKQIIDKSEWQDYYHNTYKTLNRFPIGNLVDNNINIFKSSDSTILSIFYNDQQIF